MNNLRERGGLWAIVRHVVERDPSSKERSRVEREAKELTRLLLRVPREAGSVLHERTEYLSDGMHAHIKLINTANANSLRKLLAAKHAADRVEVSVGGAKEPQSNYSVKFNFHDKSIGYSKSSANHFNILQVFKGFEGYVASEGVEGYRIPFDNQLQQQVYKKTADIFRNARMALK